MSHWMRTPVEQPKPGELFDDFSGLKKLRQVRDTSEGGESPTCCGPENRHEENAPAGKLLRDKGIAKVTSHNEHWMGDAITCAEALIALRDGDFTGEDLRFAVQAGVGFPKHHNAWGALINILIKRKIIVLTGTYRPMRDEISHARRTPVYRRSIGKWDT